jgi:hypothetical protein
MRSANVINAIHGVPSGIGSAGLGVVRFHVVNRDHVLHPSARLQVVEEYITAHS